MHIDIEYLHLISASEVSARHQVSVMTLDLSLGLSVLCWADLGQAGKDKKKLELGPELKLGSKTLCVYVCSVVSDSYGPMDCRTCQAPLPMEFSSKNTGVGYHFRLQRIFPTHGSNPGLLYCMQILLSSEPSGKPKNVGVGGYPFSRESSQPKNWTRVSCITGRFFTSWTIRGALQWLK